MIKGVIMSIYRNLQKSAAILVITVAASIVTPAAAQIVHNNSVVIDGSLCVGLDCAAGISFGFDTEILKENNLRILFDDTSSAGSFPNVDWRLIANDSSNGGANKFSIQNVTDNRIPFTIRSGARTNSLVVDDQGQIGIGTINAAVNLHVITGNTPTLRLEQDGSSGFAPQSWDIAGNETNFFIRDVTGGSTLPFRIRPGAPTSAILIDGDGDVGIGTSSPDATLDIEAGSDDASIILTQTGAVDQKWEFRNKQATGNLNIANLTTGNTPIKVDNDAANNLLKLGDNVSASTVYIAGDLVVTGDCTETDGACADYVFAPDYEKMTLTELKTFIETNKHLPNVPSQAEMMKNGVSLTNMSGRLLEKVEELVLYTIEQDEKIDALEAELRTLQSTEARLTALEMRLEE
jgi:hypothetical protein